MRPPMGQLPGSLSTTRYGDWLGSRNFYDSLGLHPASVRIIALLSMQVPGLRW
jgi:hypothetical protein